MKKRKVAIIGCGAILNRHIDAIKENSDLYELAAVCDIQEKIAESVGKKHNVPVFYNIDDCLSKSNADFYSIMTPNYLHYEQAKKCINLSKDVLIEKPAAMRTKDVEEILKFAKEKNVKAYCVLQVRLNKTVAIIKNCIDQNLLGKIRSVSLVQRWQRPVEYFSGWRAIPELGGGTLHEVGIHYIDIMQYLMGVPKITASKTYNTKHKDVEIEDTIYSILDFGEYGGTLEVTIAAEPQNLECSLSILGSNGYLKLGGKALNMLESYNFLSYGAKKSFEHILQQYDDVQNLEPNSYGSYLGSCPNHGDLYKNIENFDLNKSLNSLGIIQEIYKKSGREY